MTKPYILIFGAGKIGRSFIGQLFGTHGYDVVFVDTDRRLVEALNRQKRYPVVVRDSDFDQEIMVEGVSAINAEDQEKVIEAITDASLMAVSVGKNALPAIAAVLAGGLLAREKRHPGRSLDIILAENMRSADLFLRRLLREALPSSYPLDKQVGLVETSIGKMVPIITDEDLAENPLKVFAEPYNTLILDRKGFRGEIPVIPELSFKENMKAWVDRKAFIHNLGHASASYCGYLRNASARYLYEVLEDQEVLNFTKGVMQQAAKVLMAIYPEEFTTESLHMHIEDLLLRFRNRKLGDSIFRVGCDLQRKLGADDRFMAVIRMAEKTGLDYTVVIRAMSMGFAFEARDENGRMFPGDEDFHKQWKQDPDRLLKEVCGLNPSVDAEIIHSLKTYLPTVL